MRHRIPLIPPPYLIPHTFPFPMPAAAILPVKRLGAAKQRLSGAVGADVRAALAAAMLADVLAALGRASAIEAIVLVSGDPAAAAHADSARGIELVHDPGDA